MLSEKLAATLSEKQLRDLIKIQGKKANVNLRGIHSAQVETLSGAFVSKVEPYLLKNGTAKNEFRVRYNKQTPKKQLITALLNIQYFNEHIGTAEQIKKRAEETAKKYKLDIEDTSEYWKLVRAGFDATGYRVDSDSIMKIVAERMRAGQTSRGIKTAITKAAKAANDANEYITKFSKGGHWL